jgi:rubrerythrin
MKNYSSKATEALEMVKGIYAGILVNPPSKIDALRSALKLEQELSGFHLDVIAIFQDEGMKKMFRAMMMADNQHIQSIETMYQKHLRI